MLIIIIVNILFEYSIYSKRLNSNDYNLKIYTIIEELNRKFQIQVSITRVWFALGTMSSRLALRSEVIVMLMKKWSIDCSNLSNARHNTIQHTVKCQQSIDFNNFNQIHQGCLLC